MQATFLLKGPAMAGPFRCVPKEFDMDFYRSPSDTENRPAIATPAVIERRVLTLKAAPSTDVMYEQLDYLVGHSDEDCPSDCKDCDRLQKIRTLLLLPFRSDS